VQTDRAGITPLVVLFQTAIADLFSHVGGHLSQSVCELPDHGSFPLLDVAEQPHQLLADFDHVTLPTTPRILQMSVRGCATEKRSREVWQSIPSSA
jgi:hypothetical protein